MRIRKAGLAVLLGLLCVIFGTANGETAEGSDATLSIEIVDGAAGNSTVNGAGDVIPAASLRISEVMASNKETLEDAFGRSPDWIEIYNPTDETISLNGVCLSDDKTEPDKYTFPADAAIRPDEYVIVFASGAKKDICDEYHTSFKLKAEKEAVYLSFDGMVIDAVLFENQRQDISLALDEDGQYRLTVTPTPGDKNVITQE